MCSEGLKFIQRPDRIKSLCLPKISRPAVCDLTVYEPLASNFIIFFDCGPVKKVLCQYLNANAILLFSVAIKDYWKLLYSFNPKAPLELFFLYFSLINLLQMVQNFGSSTSKCSRLQAVRYQLGNWGSRLSSRGMRESFRCVSWHRHPGLTSSRTWWLCQGVQGLAWTGSADGPWKRFGTQS